MPRPSSGDKCVRIFTSVDQPAVVGIALDPRNTPGTYSDDELLPLRASIVNWFSVRGQRALKGATWRDLRSSVKQQYLLNKYRVLLSRAREGFIVWVPPGDADDPTREPARLDRTAAFLERAGLDCVSEE